MDRRHWLGLVLASSASTLLGPHLSGATGSQKQGVRHGLFFDPEAVEDIRKRYLEDPLFAGLRAGHAAFDYDAEIAWMDNELRHNDQLFHIRRLGDTAMEAAFIALMTGDSRARNLAQRAVREIMRFERWDFFLDGDVPIAVQRASQITVTVSLVVDFLGNELDAGERREWIRTMWERGCIPCFRTIEDIRHPRSVVGWRFDPDSTFFEHRPGNLTDMNRRPEITFNTNLRAVPASALVIGTVAYELEFGRNASTKRSREMGIWGLEDFREFFKKDGSYDEEVNYANYTAFHIAQAAVALRRQGGEDLTGLIDWDAFTDFLLNMSMPTEANPYGVVNWGDSGKPPGTKPTKRTALPLWIAGETGNPYAQGYAMKLAGGHNFWSALFYDPGVKPELPPNRPELWVSELDRVVARTGYEKEHLVVAMRSGPPANHEQADRNSIIIKCFGQELVTDPLRPAYSYSDPAWRMRLTEGHSAVLVDGRGHEHHNGVEGTNASNSYARIVRHEGNERFATWVSDATQPYRLVDAGIRSVVRSVAVFYGLPAVVIVDRVRKWEKPSRITSRFYGYNYDGALRLSADGKSFLVERPGAVAAATVACTASCSCVKGHPEIPEDTAKLHPFVDVSTEAAEDITLVTVLSLARTTGQLPRAAIRRDGGVFRLDIGGEQAGVEDGEIVIS